MVCACVVGCDRKQVVVTTTDVVAVEKTAWRKPFSPRHECDMVETRRVHHFSFSAKSPGVVSIKENSDSESTFVMLFGNQQRMSFRQLLLQLGFLLPGSCIFISRSESTVEMVQNILYAQIRIWQIMSTHLICHLPKISMGELLHHTRNECGNEESVQREPVRNSRTQLNILSTVCYIN